MVHVCVYVCISLYIECCGIKAIASLYTTSYWWIISNMVSIAFFFIFTLLFSHNIILALNSEPDNSQTTERYSDEHRRSPIDKENRDSPQQYYETHPLVLLAYFSPKQCRSSKALEMISIPVNSLPSISQLNRPMQFPRRIAPVELLIEALSADFYLWDQWTNSLSKAYGCGGLELIFRVLELRKLLSDIQLDSFMTRNVPVDSRYLYKGLTCPFEEESKLKLPHHEWKSVDLLSEIIQSIQSYTDEQLSNKILEFQLQFVNDVALFYKVMKFNVNVLSLKGKDDPYKFSAGFENTHTECKRRDILIVIQQYAKVAKRLNNLIRKLPILLPMGDDPVTNIISNFVTGPITSSSLKVEDFFNDKDLDDDSFESKRTRKVLSGIEQLRYDSMTNLDYQFILMDEKQLALDTILWKRGWKNE